MHIGISSLALLLTGSLLAAQVEVKAQAPHGQVENAAACKADSATPLHFSVRGLTTDNANKIDQSLKAMETQIFVCAGCKHEQSTAGKCAPCNLDRVSTKVPLFLEAVSSVDDATIRLTPMAARTLRYSELESALTKNSIQIDATQFPIAGTACLVLVGGTLENSRTIEKGLMDAKLFDTAKVEYDTASGEIRVSVRAGATPPMRAKLISTLDGLGTKAKLTDILWGAPTTMAKV
jgi:hypothetical protein